MKINCKQTIAKLFSPFNMFVVLLAGVMIILLSFSTSFAPTKMSDKELSAVEGQALFSITQFTNATFPSGKSAAYGYETGSSNIVRLRLGIIADMNLHMRSFKLGYYDQGSQTGWDQDHTNWYFGTRDRSQTLKWSGVFIDFGFDNMTSVSTRTLNYIEIGTMSASGQVTQTLNTINGLISSVGTGQNSGVMLRQTAAGSRIVNFNNEVMSFVFASKYRYAAPQGNWTDSYGTDLSGIFIKIPFYSNADCTRP
jgi:hypothetical protein